jgi:hypothetical protein
MTPEQEQKIRLRALEIWREEGCPEGRASEHWERAEREMRGEGGGEGSSEQAADHAGSAEATENPPAKKKGGLAAI